MTHLNALLELTLLGKQKQPTDGGQGTAVKAASHNTQYNSPNPISGPAVRQLVHHASTTCYSINPASS